jgi:Tol biopolymer transport system component
MVAKINDVDQLVIYDLKSKQRRVISSPVQPERETWQWSPDGKHVAFLAVNPANQHYEIYVADVATGRSSRVADTGGFYVAAATLYRWRDNGSAIDFITGTSPDGKSAAQVRRVTLSGTESVVRSLPSAPQGNGTDGGYRLISDSLVIVGTDKSLIGVPLPAGEPRTLAAHSAFWDTTLPRSLLSPDGRWIAFGSVGIKDGVKKPQWAIASVDGTEFRLLGAPMGCDAVPSEWIRDSRALLAFGAPSCENFHWETDIVPIDGGPSHNVNVPENTGYTLTPDSRSLLVAAEEQASGSIVTYDVAIERR